MSMSINDDDKLRTLKESWRLMEDQMAGTEDKRGHENVDDQGKEVTKTGSETNPEAQDGAQHTTYSKPLRNGPSVPVKENPALAAMDGQMAGNALSDDDAEEEAPDALGDEGMEDPDALGGDEMGDELGSDEMGDELGAEESPWDKISRAFGELQAAFDALKAEEQGEPEHGGDELGGETAPEGDLDEVITRYAVTESAKSRMQRIREARARRNK